MRNNNHNQNNNNNNQQPRRNNNKRPPLTKINIRGWQKSNAASNPDGGVQSLCSWLEKKASRKVIKSYVQGDILVISVNPDDADRFLHLNGFTFANANIAVENFSNQNNNNNDNNNNQVPNGPRNQQNNQNNQNNNRNNSQNNKGNNNSNTGNNNDTSGADQVEAALIAVIQRCYNPGMKMLALDSLPAAAEFVAIGLHAQPASKVFSALFVCCETKVFETPLKRQQMVELLTLRGNGLTTVKDCIAAAGTFNTIKGLDLSENSIKDVAELRYWRNRFPDLEHLALNNNPVNSEETLRKLRTWWPKLKTYNAKPVEELLQLESPKPVDVPVAAIELLPNSRHPEIPLGSDYGQPGPGKAGDQVIREQMILRFSYETRLRLSLSEDAIRSNQFDYNAALAQAARLLAEGKIQDTEAFMWAPRSTN